MEIDAYDLLEERGNVGAVVLSVIGQVFQRQFFGVVVGDVGQQAADGSPALFILGHGIEQGRGELGAKGKEQQLQTGFDPQLGVGPALLGKLEDLAGIKPQVAVAGLVPGGFVGAAGREIIDAAFFEQRLESRGGKMQHKGNGIHL